MTGLRLLVPLLAVALAGPLVAQDRIVSPHGALREECGLCHSADGWRPARIGPGVDHARWGFALGGAHGQTACRACHASLDFSGLSPDCVACHQDIHRGEFGPDCGRCHSARSFVDRSAMLSQHQSTRFPLVGVHRVADCESCHTPAAQGQASFVNRGTECQDCHLSRYLTTTDPDHEAGGFSRDCAQCHAVTDWTSARFNHEASGFPLTGRHRTARCAECHAGSGFLGAPTRCAGCHQQDYDATTDPAHAASGFSTDCASCHGTSGWDGAGFDHAAAGFPLTGAHRSASCAGCHTNGYQGGTPTTCIGCHQQDYDQSTYPNHRTAGFPTDCASCHNTTGWTGANFNHDGNWFPIYTGKHRGQWADCATCHLNPSNYAEFTCLTCHEHNQARMDDTHRGRSGYSYTSQACLRCHPRGQGD